MTASFGQRDPSPHDREMFDALRTQSAAPDVTRRVMGRLGYMRVADSVARRRRRNLWLQRGACILMMAAVTVTAWRIYDSSAAVRGPAEVTVPGAIMHDAHQRQSQFQTLIQSIRQQAQPVQPDGQLPVESVQEESEFQPTDDVNRSAGAPGQWV